MRVPLTPDTLQERCAYWQPILGLRDWRLGLSIQRMSVLDAGTYGDCQVSDGKRQARIRILDPRDIDGQDFWFADDGFDWELTLVHELLHVHLHDLWPKDDPGQKAGERAIDAIAKALIARDRQAPV